jgi:pyruvate ferredoxin oxidoreductase alpha subunit
VTRSLLTGNAAAAWGARLAAVDYVPAFPITPQTEIIETLARWIDNDDIPGRLVTLESEHSMITAAGAAAATGVRVFSATSSQGLLYGMEMLYTVAGWRAPFVLVNVSRGLAAPLTLESDHNDIMAARDSGFLQIHCATCQEVLDSTLIAYRLAEDSRVRLPVIVNLDGFYLSFTREPVEIPDAHAAAGFVGKFDPQGTRFRASTPESQAVAVLGGTPYSYFRYETHLASLNGLAVYDEISAEFRDTFGRDHPAVETWRAEDAEYLFVMLGSFATKAREAVDRLRDAGWSIGLLRPRLLRPFPADTLRSLLAGRRGVAVIDQNISMGKGGVLHTELLAALYGEPQAPPVVASFIGGLGGRDISAEEFYEIAQTLRTAADTGRTPPPRLLYTKNELREMRKLQAVAHVERKELDNDRR